ncbi:MAG: S-methyl-5-thioribose-1-phosphate isomerase [Thermoplasmata archaeon]
MQIILNGEKREIVSVWIEGDRVIFLDQRKIPDSVEFFEAKNYDDIAFAIRDMVVRGAPAIGVSAAYGMAQAWLQKKDLDEAYKVISKSRPTAYDLFYALDYMMKRIGDGEDAVRAAKGYADMIRDKEWKIGEHGNKIIKNGMNILTHCNAGALAVLDLGTALAPIRIAKKNGKNIFVWVDETRPRLQGARLTAWELLMEGIEHKIIADNAAGYVMKKGLVDMVIVGADRIAMNGDFANKIGTYEKAVLANENEIPFFVAAPVSTIDPNIKNGEEIPIELRDENEVLFINNKKIGPEGSKAYNPAFDVTPYKYVTGFITEFGILRPEDLKDVIKYGEKGK